MSEFALLASNLSRPTKTAMQLVLDFTLMVLCFLAAMVIRLEHIEFLSNTKMWAPLAGAIVLTFAVLWVSGVYFALVRFVTGQILLGILKGAVTFAVVLSVVNLALDVVIPRSVPFIAALLIFTSIGAARFAVRYVLRRPAQRAKRRVIIFGAGDAGLELLTSLIHGRDYSPVAFVDDDKRLQGMKIEGYPVYSPSKTASLCKRHGVEVILLALPTVTRKRRQQILDGLEGLGLEVKTIPAISDILSGKEQLAALRNVLPEDLLGRDPVPPLPGLLNRNIADKVVMVTGAGGSIGGELSRQVLRLRPKALILYEMSEFALYTVEAELTEQARNLQFSAKLIPVLGSVQNAARVNAIIAEFGIQTIYHAAAYKHVPMVEENIVEGIQNNVFGTLTVAEAAVANGVESMTLISTDKAVRPTNVMGATKRLSELVCQAYAVDEHQTIFSMVRFGNVLGSSGSVIPRFQSQIEAGGPVTVTHPEINRYFMTIPEAAELVIQAAAMAEGGDVFVLDMGEAVKIADLAETIIKLHGLKPYFVDSPDEHNPDQGDIAICFTGLRKGEKLFEELLVGNNPQPTEHSRIMMANEVALDRIELRAALDALSSACDAMDVAQIQNLLGDLPLQYGPLENGEPAKPDGNDEVEKRSIEQVAAS